MKTFSALISLVSAALFVQALPTPQDTGVVTHLFGKRITDGDVVLFRFGDLLEQVEHTFYSQVLAKYKAADFRAAGFDGNTAQLLTTVMNHEGTHSAFLQATLRSNGDAPLSCKFNFDAELKNVASALAFARIAEQVGTSAFSGAAHLLADPSFLSKAATILSDEARHSSILNVLSGTGTPFPSPYDIALSGSEVLALASPFIEGPCNTTIPANPTLTITNKTPVKAGSRVTFASDAFKRSTDNLFCQIISGNNTEAVSMPLSHCTIPKGDAAMGPAYIWVTSTPEPLPNDVVSRDNSKVVAGPTLAFIDN